MDLAFKMIDIAAEAGADAVKFQSFKAEKLVTKTADKARYQEDALGGTETQFEMLKRLELRQDMHQVLKDHCEQAGIQFMSTPFDESSADFLVDLGVDVMKIPSGEITNLPYLRHMGQLGKRIILSTGMSSLDEVREAVAVLEKAGTGRDHISLLHCNTQYPTPLSDANLLAIRSLAEEFPDCSIGFSDHTLGVECAVAAVGLGAKLVEKHFTLDKSMEGPDHGASAEPDELRLMIKLIRNTELALGTGHKEPSPSEKENVDIARKYLVAGCDIAKGESFSPENVRALRTGRRGVSPMRWDEVMGSTADRDYSEGDMLVF
ncbi:N-acetylneuraminate synthase [Pseudodesulfovibrio sp. zrk46]|nr:N-acetylneuraminate synthase [Pseudodesulfovibrio sp. zrk46]